MIQARQTAPVGAHAPPHALLGDVQRWLRACKEGTVFCVRGLLAGARSVVDAVAKLFQLSGKDRVPHSEF